MRKSTEQERKDDQHLLKQMGIAGEGLVYPEGDLTEDERILELQWRMIMARN